MQITLYRLSLILLNLSEKLEKFYSAQSKSFLSSLKNFSSLWVYAVGSVLLKKKKVYNFNNNNNHSI